MNNERDIMIAILAGSMDDEAHPNYVRLAMDNLKITGYEHEPVFKEVEKLEAEFESASKYKVLRAYYSKQSPLSLIECFQGYCCHQYR